MPPCLRLVNEPVGGEKAGRVINHRQITGPADELRRINWYANLNFEQLQSHDGSRTRRDDDVAAFHAAKETIEAQEAAQSLTPSDPQISVGAAIEPILRAFEQRLGASASSQEAAKQAH